MVVPSFISWNSSIPRIFADEGDPNYVMCGIFRPYAKVDGSVLKMFFKLNSDKMVD